MIRNTLKQFIVDHLESHGDKLTDDLLSLIEYLPTDTCVAWFVDEIISGYEDLFIEEYGDKGQELLDYYDKHC